jgi:hypothetical protein
MKSEENWTQKALQDCNMYVQQKDLQHMKVYGEKRENENMKFKPPQSPDTRVHSIWEDQNSDHG